MISWGLRARKGNRRIIQLTYKYGGVRPLSESRLEVREKGDKIPSGLSLHLMATEPMIATEPMAMNMLRPAAF